MLNFGVILGWPTSQKQTSMNNHLFLDKTLFDVSNLPSCKYASTFLNETNTILIAKTESKILTTFLMSTLKSGDFKVGLHLF